MVKSMTGYGRFEVSEGSVIYAVEVKSVNHRYFEFSCRVPRGYAFLEEKLKSFFSSKISRGKVDVYIGIESYQEADKEIVVNKELAVEAPVRCFDKERELLEDLSLACDDVVGLENGSVVLAVPFCFDFLCAHF